MGKIARDQHLPAIAASPDFVLAATMSPHGEGVDGVEHFHDYDAFLATPGLEAVALCSPPQVRRRLAAAAIAAGKAVFLEKPPGATLSEVAALREAADQAGVSLFASWHSRHAAGVEPARAWLAGKAIDSVRIVWREDVRRWHPGQTWIWQAGGLGVFDPGINALSILTRILAEPVYLEDARLEAPENCEAPIAAQLGLRTAGGTPITADFDFRQTGPQTWDIVVETGQGALTLSQGGAILRTPDAVVEAEDREYPGLYDRFAALVRAGESEVDVRPMQIVADAFLKGERTLVEPFHE